MRFIVRTGLLLLALQLTACGASAPKDYSDATPLKPIESGLRVTALWAAPTGALPGYAHAQLLPAVADDRIYVADVTGWVGALDIGDGSVVWERELGEVLTGGPGVETDLLFVGTRKAEVIALDRRDGTLRWRARVSSEVLASPQPAGGLLIVQTIDGRITALDRVDGKSVWTYTRSTPKLTLRGTGAPLVTAERVLAGFADGKLVALDRMTGRLQWEATVAVPHGRTELERLVDIDGLFQVHNGTVYVSSYQGRISAISEADGRVIWRRDMSSYTGLTVGDGGVFVSDDTSRVWALDAGTGATLWRQTELEGRETTAPIVVGDTVVVADYDGYVHWLATDDGRFVARRNLDRVWGYRHYVWENEEDVVVPHRTVSVVPLAAANTLFVRDNLGALVAFRVVP
jgi:outer membrane protein assembly factor BamB